MDSRPPVLWKSPFRDIHASGDFDASKDFFLKRLWYFAGIEENAIHPHSDDHSVFDGLEMNIGGLLLHGVKQNAIDQFYNWGSGLILEQIVCVSVQKSLGSLFFRPRGYNDTAKVDFASESEVNGIESHGLSSKCKVPLAGLEPARGFPQQILNLLRLPFRHSDFASQECIATGFSWVVPQ